MDVGGGSTEYSLHRGREVIRSKSFNIGTIRLLADKVKKSEWQKMQEFLQELSRSPRNIEFVGSGGVSIQPISYPKDQATLYWTMLTSKSFMSKSIDFRLMNESFFMD